MKKGRLEAFSDGVLAIILTIMVLELKIPHGENLQDLTPMLPIFLSYVLSFIFVGIYWSNHHHLFHAVENVDGKTLWANLHLLFWLSLVPVATAWIGEHHTSPWPAAMYGVVLIMAAIAYYILTKALFAAHGKNEMLERALGNDFKGKISVVIYAIAIPSAFVSCWLSYTLYILVAVMWLVPDRRIEKNLSTN